MTDSMTITLAKRIANKVNDDWGEHVCGYLDVLFVWRDGVLDDASIESRIRQEFAEYELTP
jgi:hypothetical protein